MKIYIDLLPEDKKKEIRRNKLFRAVLRQEILFLLPVLLFIAILCNIFYVLRVQRDATTAAGSLEQSQEKYQQLATYENKFKQVNDTVATISKIQDGHLKWENVFTELGNIVPDGVYMTDLSTKNYNVFLIGKAKTRDDLLNFKSNLESSKCFQNINVPLSNLTVKEDVDFQMDFSIKEDCLKQ